MSLNGTERVPLLHYGGQASTSTGEIASLAGNTSVALSTSASGAENAATLQAAIDASTVGTIFRIVGGDYTIDTSAIVPGGKQPVIQLDGATINGGLSSDFPGLQMGWAGGRWNVVRYGGASGTDAFDEFHYRRADYTGGTPGYVNTSLWVQTDTSAGCTSFEWNAQFTLNNAATGGQNSALSSQTNINTAGVGPTWVGVDNFNDNVVAGDPAANRVSREINHLASGTDANNARAILDVVGGTSLVGGATKPDFRCGIRITPFNEVVGEAWFKSALEIKAEFAKGLRLYGLGSSSQTAVSIEGTLVTGIDLTTATISGFAFQSAGFSVAPDAGTPANKTNVLLSINNGSVVARTVEVGAADSGGTGYRMLRVLN